MNFNNRNKIKSLCGACILMILSLPIFNLAQSPLGEFQLHLTSDEGLSDHYFKKILEDKDGFTWILSSSGVSRFDGANIESIESPVLIGGNYTDMAMDTSSHTLWVGSTYGFYKIDLSNFKVKGFYPEEGNVNTIPHQIINSLFLDRNNKLWICTQFGLAFLDLQTEQIQQIPINFPQEANHDDKYKIMYSIVPDPRRNHIYWLSTNYGFLKFDLKKKSFSPIEPSLPGLKGIDQYRYFYCDTSLNRIYAVIQSNAGFDKAYDYIVFNPIKEEYEKGIKVREDWSGTTIFPKSESTLWLASLDGLAEFDLKSSSIENIYLNDDFSNLSLDIDYIDSENRIWSGNQDGIFVYCEKFTESEDYYYETDLPKSYHVATSLYVDDEKNTIFLTAYGSDGIYSFDLENKSWKTYKPHINLGRDTEIFAGTTVQEDNKDRVIVFDEEELYRLENGEFRTVEMPLDPKDIGYITKAMMARDGIIWMMAKKGLFKLDLEKNAYKDYSEIVSNCSDVKSKVTLFEDTEGNIWISGHCYGFQVYDKKNDTFYSSEEIALDTILTISLFKSIKEYNNIVYLLSSGWQLAGFDITHFEAGEKLIQNIDKAVFEDQSIKITHGHSDYFDRAEDCAFDKEGNLWIVSPTGFIKYNLKDEIEIFDETDNLILECREMKVFVAGLLTQMENGQFIYASRKGIHLFDPRLIGVEEKAPKPYVKQFYVNNTIFEGDSLPYNRFNYILKPGQHFMSIEYSSIDYSDHANTIYAYKLDGIDEDWVETRGRNFASYTNLKGGDYKFSLKARNYNGPWNPEEVKLSIHIKNYWWNTLWAKFGFFVLIGSVFYLFYRQRIERAVEKQRLLNEHEKKLAEVRMNALTAQMNPHFIFNSLNSIDYFILQNNTEKASDYLNRFSRLIRLILNHSRSNYVSLKDDLDALKLYIEIESLRFSNKFDYVVRADKDLDLENITIPPMIFQPYVENAIWHGLMHKDKDSHGKIEIDLSLNEMKDTLFCTIKDNGIGRKRAEEYKSKSISKKKKSMGMQIIQDKLEILNNLNDMKASVEITDLLDEDGNARGTQVFLTIPI